MADGSGARFRPRATQSVQKTSSMLRAPRVSPGRAHRTSRDPIAWTRFLSSERRAARKRPPCNGALVENGPRATAGVDRMRQKVGLLFHEHGLTGEEGC